MPSVPTGPAEEAGISDPLARPILIVGPPRSGARLLAQALKAVPSCWTIAGAPGALLSAVPELDPPDGSRGGRLVATDCRPDVQQQLHSRLRAEFEVRETQVVRAAPRLFDASPRNALLVPFLQDAFPDATFVYVDRDPADSLAESLAIWQAGTAVTYPELPNWIGRSWSFLLVPGWEELIGSPLAEIVTEQWVRTMRILTADLEALAPHQWCVTHYDALCASPHAELNRLLRFVGLAPPTWSDLLLDDSLPSLVRGAAEAARAELDPYLQRTRELADHARGWVAHV